MVFTVGNAGEQAVDFGVLRFGRDFSFFSLVNWRKCINSASLFCIVLSLKPSSKLQTVFPTLFSGFTPDHRAHTPTNYLLFSIKLTNTEMTIVLAAAYTILPY